MSQRRSSLPVATHTRLQWLLNAGDIDWFLKHPGERERRRFYFRGEAVQGDDRPSRFVIVTRTSDSSLTRRFVAEEGSAV